MDCSECVSREKSFRPALIEVPTVPCAEAPQNCDLSNSRIAEWLQERLLEERRLLEHRHAALCEALILEFRVSEYPRTPEILPEEPELCTPAEFAEVAEEGACVLRLELDDHDFSHCSVEPKPITPAMQPTADIRPKRRTVETGLARIVLGTSFELCFGFLIFVNSVVMVLEAQYKGILIERQIGYTDVNSSTGPVRGWPQADLSFLVLDWIFGVAFTVEVVLKVAVKKHRFVLSGWNMFDSMVVAFWLFSLFEGVEVFSEAINPLIFRICRLMRLCRLIRLAKVTTMLDTLVLMVISVRASIAVLFWGVMLLFATTTVSALMLQSLLEDFVSTDSPDVDMSVRHAVHRQFGTYTRSMVTMWEITLANWVPPCRLLVDNVSEYFAIFVVAYKCIVGFAVLKVITGVFLHETFRTAGLDDDVMIQNRRMMRERFRNKMLTFFDEADVGSGDGDGVVSCEEFGEMIADDRVHTWLEAMDLRIRDVGADRIFAYLAGPDGVLTRDELCLGMSRLRGPAQGLDVLSLLEIASPEIKMPPSRDTKRLSAYAETRRSNLRLYACLGDLDANPARAGMPSGSVTHLANCSV